MLRYVQFYLQSNSLDLIGLHGIHKSITFNAYLFFYCIVHLISGTDCRLYS